MKRTFTFLLFALTAFSFSLQARDWTVTNATELRDAWNGAAAGDVILLAPGTYSYGSGGSATGLQFPIGALNGPSRRFTVKSLYDQPDSMAVLITDIGQPLAGSYTEGGRYRGGIIFENIDLRQRTGANGSSGHIIYINMFKGQLDIDTLAFRNCIINQSPRGLLRTVVDTMMVDGVSSPRYPSAGDLDFFEMSNCIVREMFVTSSNGWPLVYLAHYPVEMLFEGNTFYNMPYLKNIFTMNYAETEGGRNAEVTFKNNLFAHTLSNNAYVSLGSYLGAEAVYNFENNIFALPDWSNAWTLSPDSTGYIASPSIIRCSGGLIFASNNLIQGPGTWESGNTNPVDAGGFILLDTKNDYDMESLGVTWKDFADAEMGDFSFLAASKLATAGTDGGPIGPQRWLKNYANPRTLTVTANDAAAKVTPRRAYYEDGTEVNVSASAVDGANFESWRENGSVISLDNPYKFNITADKNLVATYSTALNKNVEITISGSTTASYTITPAKDVYYIGDAITITLNPHIDTFLNWSDGSTDLVRNITITDDVKLTANFKQTSYVLAWDFHQLTGNNQTFKNLEANHAINADNLGSMNYMQADTIANLSTRNNKFTGYELKNCAVRRLDEVRFDNPDYIFIEFSTKDLKNVTIKSLVGSDNSMFKINKMQYSLDGTTYTDFSVFEFNGEFNVWQNFEGVLPVEAENQDKVYVRWFPDVSSEWIKAPESATSTSEYQFLTNVIISSGYGDGDATWRVDPFETYTAGQQIVRTGITLTLANVGYTDVVNPLPLTTETNELNGIEYVGRLGGTENPRSVTNGNFSNSNPASVPIYGTFWKFEPTVNGELEMAVYVNANKPSYITEDGAVVGGVGGQYDGFTVEAGSPMAYKIDVTAGKTYLIFSPGSKMGILGFVFKSETSVEKILKNSSIHIYSNDGILFINTEKADSAEIFTTLGQKVAQKNLRPGLNEFPGLQSGIYIVRVGSEAQKVIVR